MKTLLKVLLAMLVFWPVAEARDVEVLLRTMTIEEKIGQMLLPAFRNQAGRNVTNVTAEVAQTVKSYNVGGVILFSENLRDREQTIKLIADLQIASPKLPLFIGIDQEGGRVTRLPYGVILPGNMALAATGKTENAYLAARASGEELAELGFNLNFAPVLDLNSNPDNSVIGVRSFSEDPLLAAAMGKAYIKGLHAAGIAAVVKHFPGHGDTAIDSHLGLPVLFYNLEQLEARELLPFRLALEQSPDMVMTAHIALPKIERATAVSYKTGMTLPLPATLSSVVLTEILRNKMGYDGVIITDALNMRAISEHFGAAEAAIRAIVAGADILLMPELEPSFPAILAAVKRGEISEPRIDQSVRRILKLKEKQGLFAVEKGASPTMTKKARTALEASLADQAVTLLKNDTSVLPFIVRPGTRMLLLAPKADQLDFMRQESEQIFRLAGQDGGRISRLVYGERITDAMRTAIEAADQIILVTDSKSAADADPARSPVAATVGQLVRQAKTSGKQIAVMAARTPYDIMQLEFAPAFLSVYAPVEPNIAAGIRLIFGNIRPQGKLPVTIPDKNGGVLYPRGHGLRF